MFTTRSRIAFLLTLAAAALALVAGCQPRHPLGGSGGRSGFEPALWPGVDGDPDPVRPRCDVLAAPAVAGGSFVFALTDSVLPVRAPVPHNPSERIVFAQLYETLVNRDCAGELSPGLAGQWTCTEDSTVWVFTLRDEARFWDGSRVNAGDVKQAWCANESCPGGAKGRISPWGWMNAKASSITVLDARRLSIRLPEPQADFPTLLAHPATAVAVPREGWIWPVGTGPARLRAATPPPLPDLECRPNVQHPRAPAWKELTFLVRPGADARDLVDADFDLMQVRDLDAVRFYGEMPGYEAAALPWNRLYLLLCPPERNASGSTRWSEPAHGIDPAAELTRISARPWPEIVLPAGAGSSCPQLTGPVASSGVARLDWGLDDLLPDANVLLYDRDDPGARELAQRLAALGDAEMRTAGLPRGAVDFALHWQMAGACIVPMDLEFSTTCLQLASLLGRASWLQEAALTGRRRSAGQTLDPESLAAAERLDPGAASDPAGNLERLELVHPLALTHSWLISRGPLAGVELAHDGAPLLSGLGRPAVRPTTEPTTEPTP